MVWLGLALLQLVPGDEAPNISGRSPLGTPPKKFRSTVPMPDGEAAEPKLGAGVAGSRCAAGTVGVIIDETGAGVE